MIVIKELDDIHALRAEGQPPHLVGLADRRFRELTAAYADCGATFDPEEHGPIVIIERGDDVRDLSEIGLNPEDGGLLGAIKEAVIHHQGAYEVLVLYSNDYGVIFLCPDELWLDAELRAILDDEVAETIIRTAEFSKR